MPAPSPAADSPNRDTPVAFAPAFTRVEAGGLTKLYGVTRALAGVSLHLRAGEVTVIEGPNGSGKSTLMGLLSSLVRPTRGSLRYGELSFARHQAKIRSEIGVLAHQAMLYPDLSAGENLLFFAGLHALPDPAKRVEELRERFGIGRFGDRPVRTYSRGQLQRASLARAILHRPSLLLLDEPTTGLDTKGVERVVEMVRAERERGAILALITHDPILAGELADQRVRLRRGKRVDEEGAS